MRAIMYVATTVVVKLVSDLILHRARIISIPY